MGWGSGSGWRPGGGAESGGSIPVVTNNLVNLQVVKMVVGEPGTSTASNALPIKVSTRDPVTTTTLWALDNSNGVWNSTDDGSTWTKTGTAGTSGIKALMVISTGTVLAITFDGTPVYHIYRSTDTGVTWTKVMDFNSGSLGVLGPPSFVDPTSKTTCMGSMCEDPTTSDIYVAEYCPTNQTTVNLYKSTDDGATWTAIYSFAQGVVRHFHGVIIDPYVTSRIWVTIGDTGTQQRIGYSDDGGVTFTWITQGLYPKSRAVGLVFDADYVYWCPDTPDERAGIYRYNRISNQIDNVDVGGRTFMTPFYFSAQFNGMFVYAGAAEFSTSGWNGDGFVYMLGGNATNWRHMGRWYGTSSQPCVPVGITAPDSNGAFWVCFQQLADTAVFNNYISVKFQMEAVPFIDSQPLDYHRDMIISFRELELSVTIPVSVAATSQYVICQAPFDMVIETGTTFSVTSTLTADASNYWTIRVDRFVAGSFVKTLASATSATTGWTAYATRAADTDSGPQIIKEGDVIAFRIEKTTGSPSNAANPAVTIPYRRIVSPTP